MPIVWIGVSVGLVFCIWNFLAGSAGISLSGQVLFTFGHLFRVGLPVVALALALLSLSYVARALRYQVIARLQGERMPLLVALQAILIGRSITLVTPMAVGGGQAFSYWVMMDHGITWRTSGLIVIITTFLDFIFFTVISSIFVFFGSLGGSSSLANDILFYKIFFWTCLAGLATICSVCFMMTPIGVLFIRPIAVLLGTLPFWEAHDLEFRMLAWSESCCRFFCKLFRSFPTLVYIVVLTVLGILPHYLGINFLLQKMGVNFGTWHGVLRQIFINTASLFGSPGAGTVTGDFGFQYFYNGHCDSETLLSCNMVFNAFCFWIPILAGLVVALFVIRRARGKCVVPIYLTRQFLAENATVERIRVRCDDGMCEERHVGNDGSFVFSVAGGTRCSISVILRDGEEMQLVQDYKPRRNGCCKPLEIGREDPWPFAHSLPIGAILKARLYRHAVGFLVPFIRRRIMKNRKLLSKREGARIGIPTDAYGKGLTSAMKNLVTNFWDKCGRKEKTFILKTVRGYLESRVLRVAAKKKDGSWMPALMSLQVTDACNIRCKGCQVSCNGSPDKLARYRVLRYLLSDFHAEGGRHVLLLGGETTLLGDYLLKLVHEFDDITFALFSNALLLDEKYVRALGRHDNVLPIFSIDGTPLDTEWRRGKGVFEKVLKAQEWCNRHGLLNGISIMLHEGNAQSLRDNKFMMSGFGLSHKFVLFTTYTDTYGRKDLTPLKLPLQCEFYDQVCALRRDLGYPFYMLPQDEMYVHNGCAAGIGIFHVTERGTITPCPFMFAADMSANVVSLGLKEALRKVTCTCGEKMCLANSVKHGRSTC